MRKTHAKTGCVNAPLVADESCSHKYAKGAILKIRDTFCAFFLPLPRTPSDISIKKESLHVVQ